MDDGFPETTAEAVWCVAKAWAIGLPAMVLAWWLMGRLLLGETQQKEAPDGQGTCLQGTSDKEHAGEPGSKEQPAPKRR